ncbi:MAG: Flagellar hook-length control protein FliK [Bacteroidetes bacterium]|jgi:hypothetical protein|nr:Flagellar hook-length control protein FliK [Bacteroidota bacterium]
MIGLIKNTLIILIAFFGFGPLCGYSQNIPQGFNYQTTVRNSVGISMINQSVTLRFSLYLNSPSGVLAWQEDHLVFTDDFGMAKAVIGKGISTGAGSISSFSAISWGSASYFLKISLDPAGGAVFTDMGVSQLFSVPYSLFSLNTARAKSIGIVNMTDADITSIAPGKLLKWNGNYWIPATDIHSDTVLFAFNASNSTYSDSAMYTYAISSSDTVSFVFLSDTSAYSLNSQNTFNSVNSMYSDTALYALNTPVSTWLLNGNGLGSSARYIGTNDTADLVFKTNNTSRVLMKNNGNVLIGSSANNASLAVNGNDGLFSTGTFGSVYTPVQGAGSKMIWYPSKGAFRGGRVSLDQWDTARIGEYSMAFGYNTKSRVRSFSSGFECESVDYSFSAGRRSRATPTGPYPQGNSVSLGDSCQALSYRDVTIGRNNISAGAINILIGFSNTSPGGQSVCMGSFCNTSGNRSTVLGYRGNTASLKAGFVYSDASSSALTTPALAYQFVVRASGGVVFYSDPLNTMGVTLFAGGGSWSMISDRNKKANICNVNYESILTGINKLKIRSWNYRSQSKSIRHIGPMAQDFYNVFHLGENDVSVSSVDMDGVILSGIKALSFRVDSLNNFMDIESLNLKIEKLDDSEALNTRLDVLEEILKNE